MHSDRNLGYLPWRRSSRRMKKALDKNIQEYEIPNPYKKTKSSHQLPLGLERQLSKIDFLSVRSLQNLSFIDHSVQEEVNEMLLKMRGAVERQSE